MTPGTTYEGKHSLAQPLSYKFLLRRVCVEILEVMGGRLL